MKKKKKTADDKKEQQATTNLQFLTISGCRLSCIVCNFDLLILELMFLFFKNTVKLLKFR